MEIKELLGKTLIEIRVDKESSEIIFITASGEQYKMYHSQECCEDVTIDDIVGDIEDLIGSPIIVAEENSNEGDCDCGDHYTWTFYKLATLKGYVDIKWYGTSSGYYSESVYFVKANTDGLFPL